MLHSIIITKYDIISASDSKFVGGAAVIWLKY